MKKNATNPKIIFNNQNATKFVSDLKADSKQYKNLTKAEEQAMIKEYLSKGKEDELRKMLVMHNIRLVFSMSRKYCTKSVSFDDMIGRGLYGLCIAASRFDLTKNTKFCTYAYPWIFKYLINEFYDVYDNKIAGVFGISFNSSVSEHGLDDEENGATTVENFIVDDQMDPTYNPAIPNIKSELSSMDGQAIVHGIQNYLQDRGQFQKNDYEIFWRSLMEKQSIRDISVDLDMKPAEVNKRKHVVLTKVKSYLKDEFGVTCVADIFS